MAFVSIFHEQRVFIGLRINGNRVDAQFPAGSHDPHCNFASVGDQNFIQHALNLNTPVSEMTSFPYVDFLESDSQKSDDFHIRFFSLGTREEALDGVKTQQELLFTKYSINILKRGQLS
jgi:hypothetical protein